jgi:RNA polymerase sigma-70 factor (ECF subfamily)
MRSFRGPDPLAQPEELIRHVYSYAAYRLGDAHDAEDVTSEVFERAIRYRKSFDPARGDALAWLLGIARRCADDALSARPRNRSELEDVADGSSMEEDSVRRLTLAAAMGKLGERDQELIALRFGADLTAAQMGQVMDMETNAVEVALHRALARLRGLLEAEDAPAASRLSDAGRL